MLENSLSYPGNIRCILRINRFFRLTTFDFSLKRNLHKDVEKAFGSLKERLNIRRALVWSEQSLEGKLFVQFVALIYLSYIKKQMKQRAEFEKTVQPDFRTSDYFA
jgi:transposase